jgi:GNAT superfamily N-acetyltransferase
MIGDGTAPPAAPAAFAADGYDRGCYRLDRLRRADDAAGLAARLATMPPWSTLGYTAASLEQYLTRADAALHRFRIDVDGGAAGVLCVRQPWLRGPYIELIGLDAAGRGRGIGADLIAWLAAEAAPARNIWALVSDFNQPARRFYDRLGFAAVGTLADLVAPGCNEILLRKRL